MHLGSYQGRPVAIKTLNQDPQDDATRRAFAREAMISSLVGSHANVVKFWGGCCESGHWYMVYQFVSGGSVKDVLFSQGMFMSDRVEDVTQILSMSLDAARGVAALHAQKIIHRDLACRNLLCDQQYRVWYVFYLCCVCCL